MHWSTLSRSPAESMNKITEGVVKAVYALDERGELVPTLEVVTASSVTYYVRAEDVYMNDYILAVSDLVGRYCRFQDLGVEEFGRFVNFFDSCADDENSAD